MRKPTRAAPKAAASAEPQRPQGGGSYVRDRKTGELSQVVAPPTYGAPPTEPETEVETPIGAETANAGTAAGSKQEA